MTKRELFAYVLLSIGLHLVRFWLVYATFLVIFLAPLPVVLIVALIWTGYFTYRLRTEKE